MSLMKKFEVFKVEIPAQEVEAPATEVVAEVAAPAAAEAAAAAEVAAEVEAPAPEA